MHLLPQSRGIEIKTFLLCFVLRAKYKIEVGACLSFSTNSTKVSVGRERKRKIRRRLEHRGGLVDRVQ